MQKLPSCNVLLPCLIINENMKTRFVLISFMMAVGFGVNVSGQSCETCYARLETVSLRISMIFPIFLL